MPLTRQVPRPGKRSVWREKRDFFRSSATLKIRLEIRLPKKLEPRRFGVISQPHLLLQAASHRLMLSSLRV